LSRPFRAHDNEGMAEYRQSAHAVFDLKYHLIWCTKYWYKILRGRVAERARDLIRQICEVREVVTVRGAVSADHTHLLLAAPPVLSPAKPAQYIKGRSSRHLQAEFPELRKRYWGQHMWARGYFCATVGAVDEATIKAYIESQKWDEDDQARFMS
jgi:putative transposase